MTGCAMLTGDPKAGTCDLCGTPLPARARRWCSSDCSDLYWQNHDWGAARAATLERDGWACARCGRVGWADVPRDVLMVKSLDWFLDEHALSEEDWALVAGLVTSDDLIPLSSWIEDSACYERIRAACDALPESIRRLVRAERRALPRTRGRRGHDLEVNHIEPRRGRGYGPGCHHHLDNLETLCRPCHVDETRRQRLGLPSWRHDARPVEILTGAGVQEVLS